MYKNGLASNDIIPTPISIKPVSWFKVEIGHACMHNMVSLLFPKEGKVS